MGQPGNRAYNLPNLSQRHTDLKPTRLPRWMRGLRTHEVVLKNCPQYGLLCPDRSEIWIKRGIPREEQVISLIHELLHIHHRDLERFNLVPEHREQEVEIEARERYAQLTPRDHGLLECFLIPRPRKKGA